MRIVWTVEAISDLRGIRSYIADFNPYAADRVAADLLSAAESLLSFPLRGQAARGGRRRLSVTPPYSIWYRMTDTQVLILRVRHDRQRRLR